MVRRQWYAAHLCWMSPQLDNWKKKWKDEQPFGCVGKRDPVPHLRTWLCSNSWSTSQSTIFIVCLTRATRWKFSFSATLAKSKRLWSCTAKSLFLFSILRCFWGVMRNSEQNCALTFSPICVLVVRAWSYIDQVFEVLMQLCLCIVPLLCCFCSGVSLDLFPPANVSLW